MRQASKMSGSEFFAVLRILNLCALNNRNEIFEDASNRTGEILSVNEASGPHAIREDRYCSVTSSSSRSLGCSESK